MSAPAALKRFTFAEFEAKLESSELFRNGARVRLPDQSFQILAILLEHRGELVTREEIRQRLWRADTFVDFDHGLNNAVNRLRDALGDSADSPRFVETLPRRGYRFIAAVEGGRSSQTVVQPSDSPASLKPVERSGQPVLTVAAISGALLLAILVISAFHVRTRGKTKHFTALVVLPLENVSGDPTQEYFADGMTDLLITNLAELGSVRVISRTSAMHYKGSHKSLPEIARELDIDAVVEGTVSKTGERVRLNAQLIDANNDQHLWAREYNTDLKDVLQLQSGLASAIATEVAGKLTSNISPSSDSHAATKSRQVNPEAYEAYLKGIYFLDRWTDEGFEKAKKYFQQAIDLDPSYADSYAGLGEYYGLAAFTATVPPREAWTKSEELLTRALEIDDTSSKAHSLLGMLKLQFSCDRSAAEKELNRALALNPGDMRALDYHSYYLLEMGRTDEAIAEKRRVLEHDPLALITNADFGFYLLQSGRTDESITQFQKTLELDPNYAAAHMRLGLAYAQKQQYAAAVIEMRKAISLDINPPRLGQLGEVYARWGKRPEALAIINKLQQMSRRRYVSPTMIALIYARLNEKTAAIASLKRAKPEEEPKITDPGFENLRSDPNFKALSARLQPNPSCPTQL